MISQEEYELILSFKSQLEEKVKIYHENQIEIQKQEKLMKDCNRTIICLKKSVDEYKHTLSILKEQIGKEKEQVCAEAIAAHNKILRDKRISASIPCILLCTEIFEHKKDV